MMLNLLLNKLPTVDIVFFLICFGVIVAIIGIYFLIPVIKRKEYAERRESLRKREEAFKGSYAPIEIDKKSEEENA